jgi:hypothetical protein
MGPDLSRRAFLGTMLRAGLALPAASLLARTERACAAPPDLLQRFPDLKRHFVFEYYPWYGGPPDYFHWNYPDRNPPYSLGSNYVPRLGPYDVRSRDVLEQHARWINETGVGAIALSWWGRFNFMDQAVPLVMDVMHDHDVKVTFAMEPYADDRGQRYADDIVYLLREYGEKRGFDAFLLLRNEDGKTGPVFKGFRCILPPDGVDCHGVRQVTADYTPDDVWRRQTETLRDALRREFDHVTLLADSLEFARTPASGFDGIGIYDNFIGPEEYAGYAAGASRAGLVFSFNVNPGYDQIEPLRVPPGACYSPRSFAPGGPIDWTRPGERERAAALSEQRIAASLQATIAVQTDAFLQNVRRGFFLVYVNSFNEWHEGHAFEPMRDAADLLPEERPYGYHNPERGDYRLATLAALLEPVLRPAPEPARPPKTPGS